MENLGGQHTGPSPVLRGCLERPGKHGSQATREAGLGKIAVTRSPGACDPWLLFQAGFVMRDHPGPSLLCWGDPCGHRSLRHLPPEQMDRDAARVRCLCRGVGWSPGLRDRGLLTGCHAGGFSVSRLGFAAACLVATCSAFQGQQQRFIYVNKHHNSPSTGGAACW